MASHVEGRLCARSIGYAEAWLAGIAAAKAPRGAPAGTPATGKPAAAKPAKGGGAPAKTDDGATAMSRCCFAVGRVVEVSKHPESTKLYVERIDMGPELNSFSNHEPRTILSGLQGFVTEEDFLNRLVLVIANLEPRKIAGVPSQGMVLCASAGGDAQAGEPHGEREVVLLDVPEGTMVGERIVFEGHDMPYEPVLKKKLAKNFEEVMSEVRTNERGEVCWKGVPFKTSKGIVTASITGAQVS